MTDKKPNTPEEEEETPALPEEDESSSKESPQEGKKYDGGAIPR